MAFDIYQMITDRIIEELEKGIIPWNKPWAGTRSGAIKHTTGKPYSLLNQMLLRKPGEYLTFEQCTKEGGKVKKGEKSHIVVYWNIWQQPIKDDNGNPKFNPDGSPMTKNIPILKYFRVFHIDQCEGIEPKYGKEVANDVQPIEKAESTFKDYLARCGVGFRNIKQDEAYYSPMTDSITLPLMEQFDDSESYYATAFHEATHSTGHSTRLNRFDPNVGAAAFGSEEYSREELVAEIGSCGVLHEIGMETNKTFKNTAAYIQSWLRALKNDKRMIVSAASKAEKAIDLILNRESKKDGD